MKLKAIIKNTFLHNIKYLIARYVVYSVARQAKHLQLIYGVIMYSEL